MKSTKRLFLIPLAILPVILTVPVWAENPELGKLEVAAGEKDPEQLFLRGKAYAKGEGVAKDLGKAVEFYRKAAELGHAKAQTNLGACYLDGTGVAKDPAEALKWFRKAAEGKDAAAMYNLAWMRSHGQGAARDQKEALLWYRKSAEAGLSEAQNYLGDVYFKGIEAEPNPKEAANWYRKAANQGNSAAQNSLGVMVESGIGGMAVDLPEAFKLFKQAAEKGNTRAQANLGRMYEFGRGVEKDKVQAYYWYAVSAAKGEINGMKALQGLKVTGALRPEELSRARVLVEKSPRGPQPESGK